jgi:hypothetical protein
MSSSHIPNDKTPFLITAALISVYLFAVVISVASPGGALGWVVYLMLGYGVCTALFGLFGKSAVAAMYRRIFSGTRALGDGISGQIIAFALSIVIATLAAPVMIIWCIKKYREVDSDPDANVTNVMIDSGGGSIINGNVNTEGGTFAGRDMTTGSTSRDELSKATKTDSRR